MTPGGPTQPNGSHGAAAGPAPAPVAPVEPDTFGFGAARQIVGAAVSEAVDQVATVVKPAAVATVATTFGFPFALMIAVLLFLLVQSRLDRRDPKLRAAPLRATETTVEFEDEDVL